MPTTLPIKHLTLDEKLRALEALWADLSQQEEQVPVPQWHKAVLADRERMVREGQARFNDWDTAKKRLARRTSRFSGSLTRPRMICWKGSGFRRPNNPD